MKYILSALLLGVVAAAHASTSYNNSKVINAQAVSTGTAVSPVIKTPYNLVVDLAQADSASWQISGTCASGQIKLQQSNDGVNWVDFNTTGSSITWPVTAGATGLVTVSNQLFSVPSPAYRYVNFNVTNSSAPAAGVASNCTFTAVQLLKSITVESN